MPSLRESALSSPLALELQGIAKGKFPDDCYDVKCCPKELGSLTFAELALRAGCHPDDDNDGFFISNKVRRVIKHLKVADLLKHRIGYLKKPTLNFSKCWTM